MLGLDLLVGLRVVLLMRYKSFIINIIIIIIIIIGYILTKITMLLKAVQHSHAGVTKKGAKEAKASEKN